MLKLPATLRTLPCCAMMVRGGYAVMLGRDEFQLRQHMLREDYEIYHYVDSSELHVSLHFHDFFECYCLLSGRVSYQIDNQAYSVTPGDLLLIGPNQLHRPLISAAKLPYERIVLWISRRCVERLSTPEADLSLCFTNERYNLSRLAKFRRAAIEQKLFALLEATNTEGFGRDVLCRAKLMDLLVELNRDYLEAQYLPARAGASVGALVESVSDYLDEHLADSVRLDDLAARVYLSKYYLARTFRRETGITIFQMLMQKRMIRARNLILEGIPLSQAAALCGFSDYSGFYKAFVAEYGVSPRDYAGKSGG